MYVLLVFFIGFGINVVGILLNNVIEDIYRYFICLGLMLILLQKDYYFIIVYLILKINIYIK